MVANKLNSEIRQVPDNQEVYLSTSGFTSLTIDLCERVTSTATDADALSYHFDDVVAEGDSKQIFKTDTSTMLPKFPNVAVLQLLATVTPPSPDLRPPRANTPTYVVIFLALIRLELQMTDVVVTLNMPNIPVSQELVSAGEDVDFGQGMFGAAVAQGHEVLSEVLQSLEIKDWGLFGPGG